MNKVIMIGRLTKDPESKVTQTGKKVVSFSIALNEGKSAQGNDLVSYFNCTAWERTGEILESYARKGTKVAIVGRLQNRSWDKPDGTKGYATDIVVTELELLSSKGETDAMPSDSVQPVSSSSNAAKPLPKSGKPKAPQNDLPDIDIDSMNVQMPF
jgi:single-strand DNA-binding protein